MSSRDRHQKTPCSRRTTRSRKLVVVEVTETKGPDLPLQDLCENLDATSPTVGRVIATPQVGGLHHGERVHPCSGQGVCVFASSNVLVEHAPQAVSSVTA